MKKIKKIKKKVFLEKNQRNKKRKRGLQTAQKMFCKEMLPEIVKQLGS